MAQGRPCGLELEHVGFRTKEHRLYWRKEDVLHAGCAWDHHTSISIGCRPICSLRVADDIDLNGSNYERQDLTNRLVDRARACGMEVSTGKSKIMTNSADNINADICMNVQKVEDEISFQYPAQQKSASGLPQQRPFYTGSSTATLLASQAIPSWLWNMNPACCLWEKDPGFRNQVPEESSSHIPLGSTSLMTGCGARSTSLLTYKNLFWQL